MREETEVNDRCQNPAGDSVLMRFRIRAFQCGGLDLVSNNPTQG